MTRALYYFLITVITLTLSVNTHASLASTTPLVDIQQNVTVFSLAVIPDGSTTVTAVMDTTTTTTEKESTSTSQNYVGSNFNVGGNAAFNAADALSIMGSSVNVQDQLALNASSVIITAGTEESTSRSREETYTVGMSVSTSGAGGFSAAQQASAASSSFNASANSSDSDSYSKTHIHSSINAGSLTSTSDQLTIAGANIEIQNGIDIITGQLTIASLQDESRSRSSSEGYNVSGSVGGNLPIDPSNVGGNQNTSSSDSKWVNNQTTLIGGASGNGSVTITADKTDITGATLASATRNDDGTLTDNGTLALITDELTITNLYDYNTSKSSGVSLSVGLGWSGDKPETEEREGYASGSTTLGLTNSGHNTQQTTYATLGGGTVQKKDGTEHNLADVNTNLNNTQEITLDQQTGGLDATVTVDHRLATPEGWNNIENNFVDTYEHGQDIGRTVSAVANEDALGILNFGEALDKNAKGTQLKNDLLRNSENAHILAGLQSEDAEQYAQAMQALGQLAQNKFGLELSDINLYDASKTDSLSLADTALVNVKGGTVVDQNNQEYGNIFIDAGDGASKTDMTQTLGHEVIETQALQGKNGGLTNGLLGTNSAETKEAMANLFGAQLADRMNQAAGGELNSSGGANFASNLQNSQAVVAGTQRADNVGTAKVEHRQLYVEEAQAIIAAAPAYAAKQGISEEQAKQDLTRQALRIADQKWAAQIEENPDALAAVLEVAAITPPIKDPYVSGGLVGAFIVTPPDYENPNINANAARMLELGVLIPGEAGFMSRYATEDGRMPVELTPAQQVSESVSDLADGALNLAVSLYNDFPDTVLSIAGAVGEAVSGCWSSGLGCIAVDPREGYAGDRAFVALLQGDREGAIGQNNTVLLGETVPFIPVGIRLTTGLLDEMPVGAVTQARREGVVDGLGSNLGTKVNDIKVEYSAVNYGPLGNPNDATTFASTFRSGSYTDRTLMQDTILYRVISDDGNAAGAYWTSTPPKGPLQSVIDSALDQNWGNTATTVITARVPAGTRVFEGVSAPQRGLVGGGNQIVFDRNVNPFNRHWIIVND